MSKEGTVPVGKVGLRHLGVGEVIEGDELLRRSPLLSSLDGEDRRTLLQSAAAQRYAKGAVIFDAGSPPGGIFLVLKGEVSLSAGADAEACRVRPGEFFGEVALPGRSAMEKATAATDVDLALFPGAVVAHLCQRRPAFEETLRRVARERAAVERELEDFMQRW